MADSKTLLGAILFVIAALIVIANLILLEIIPFPFGWNWF